MLSNKRIKILKECQKRHRCMTDISKETGTTQTTLSIVISDFVEKGLVMKKMKDGRDKKVIVTEKGKKIIRCIELYEKIMGGEDVVTDLEELEENR